MLKHIIIDRYSPYKHLCQIDEYGEVIPYATYPIDHKIEGDWDDKWCVIQAYKVYKFGDQVKSTILDGQEQGKHLKLYSALLELDGRIETHPFNFEKDNHYSVTVQSREQAKELMLILLVYKNITNDNSVNNSIRVLLQLMYSFHITPTVVSLPHELDEFLGYSDSIMNSNYGTGSCEEGNE